MKRAGPAGANRPGRLGGGLQGGLQGGLAVLAALVSLAGPAAGALRGQPAATASGAAAMARPASATAPLSPPARELHAWVLAARDNEGAPFAVIDKQRATLWLFDAQGRRVGSTPVLLGLARGDASVPGIGERPMKEIRPDERTTPAGRFIVEPGHNAQGEDILWVDYEAAVSMHRVRATNPAERRLQRLDSRSPLDNRISYGCINVPADFYDRHLRPRFTQARGVVYLLPETLPLQALFRSDAGPPGEAARAAPVKSVRQALPDRPDRPVAERRGVDRRMAGVVAADVRPLPRPPGHKAPAVARAAKARPPTAAEARAMALLFARPAEKHAPARSARAPVAVQSQGQALKTKAPRPA